MNPLSSFFVRVGDLIRADPWNAAGWAIRRMRIIAGKWVKHSRTFISQVKIIKGGA